MEVNFYILFGSVFVLFMLFIWYFLSQYKYTFEEFEHESDGMEEFIKKSKIKETKK